jgi:photosystem II stability/assembly factor-like uncharacterized protein
VHKLRAHPAVPGRLFQQNHVGVYRSDDHGDTWFRIDKGLPFDYGFGLAIDVNDADACLVTPLEPEQYAFRATPGRMRVFRSNGDRWSESAGGLPDSAYLSVLREGMANDTLNPGGVYVGTGSGHLFGSADGGRRWSTLAQYLPPILSVSAAVV